MKPFQAALLIGFAVLALVAVFIFALYSGGKQSSVGSVTIWGPLPADTVNHILETIKASDRGFDTVTYRAFSADSFIPTLIEKVAAGQGPDLIIFSGDALLGNSDKLLPISYATLSRRLFQDSYVQAGEVFLTADGILGIPFAIDPLVTYWNRTLYAAGGVARPPTYWDEATEIAPHLSKSNESGTVTQSAFALGGWSNIDYAKEILVSLFVGLGTPVVARDPAGKPQAVLNITGSSGASPAAAGLQFYTDFANSIKPVYSWNKSLSESRKAFLAGTLATYFGPSSEIAGLRAANPNLNFDIAAYPQTRGASPTVPAALYALSVPRGSKNPVGAVKVALALAGPVAEAALSLATGLPSVRLDATPPGPADPYGSILRQAALNAFTFLDPDPTQSDALFARMVEAVTSGKSAPATAVQHAQEELQQLLKM